MLERKKVSYGLHLFEVLYRQAGWDLALIQQEQGRAIVVFNDSSGGREDFVWCPVLSTLDIPELMVAATYSPKEATEALVWKKNDFNLSVGKNRDCANVD